MKSLFSGIFFTLVGIGFIYWRVKHPIEKVSPVIGNSRIMMAAITFLLFGLFLLYLFFIGQGDSWWEQG